MEFKFPDVGEGIESGDLVSWKVKEGEVIKKDQPLAEVETDKAVVEIPSPVAGTITKLHYKEGDNVKVGTVLVTIDDGKGESTPKAEEPATPAPKKEEKPPASVPKPEVKEQVKEEAPKPAAKKHGASVIGTIPEYEEEVEEHHYFFLKTGEAIKSIKDLADKIKHIDDDTFSHHVSEYKNDFANWIRDVRHNNDLANKVSEAKSREAILDVLVPKAITTKVKAMPGVKKLAKEKGIDLATITGTGKHGEIRRADLGGAPSAPSGIQIKKKEFDIFGFIERIPLKGVRKVIADHLMKSQQHTVQFTVFDEADITDLAKIKKDAKNKHAADGIKVTFLPFFIRAVIAALEKHPTLNAIESDDEIIIKKYYNIGVAVDTENGLMVPVMKKANLKDIAGVGLDLASNIPIVGGAGRIARGAAAGLKQAVKLGVREGAIGGGLFGAGEALQEDAGVHNKIR